MTRSRTFLMALALGINLASVVGSAQSDDLMSIKRDLPSVIRGVRDAIDKRSSLQIPEGPLKAANSRTVAALNVVLNRLTAVDAICSIGPAKDEVAVILSEWKDVQATLNDLGITGVGKSDGQVGTAGNQQSGNVRSSVTERTPTETLPQETSAPTLAPRISAMPSNPISFAAPITNLKTMAFTYDIGVSVVFDQSGGLYQGGCTFGSGAITSDATVWDVVVTLLSNKLADTTEVGYFARTTADGVILVPIISMDPNTQFLVRGRKAYIGRAEQNVLAPKFHFRNLSLNEVTDLLEALKSNETRIQEAFAGAAPTMTVYQILMPQGTKKPAASVLNAVEEQLLGTNPDMITSENLAKALANVSGKDLPISPGGTQLMVHVEPAIDIPFSTPKLTGNSADEVSAFARRLANLGEHGNLDLTKVAGNRLTNSTGSGMAPAPKPFVIENECFQLSFTPGVQDGGLAPAASFRGRISYIPEHSPFALKLAAEGEGGQSDRNPRRIAGHADITYLSKPFAGGWYATFGATGDYSYALSMNTRVDEWRAGGKVELQAPVQHFFPVRGGNDQKPTLTLQGGAIGGTNASATVSSVVRGDFTYTLQPGERIFFDFKANGGHASDTRFGGRRDFAFGSLVGRFAIYGDWDFVAKYECGRKDPQYLKQCGWQTGFGLRTK